ncbi:hypothetical protein BO86DRAFT_415703 [Aspergillus japonicus CBS 114.51]|uniref:BTB domain-containing protein n=2 Tax=Aspergillus TaxID=5052 RepID=A0A2V5GXF6_ASPV1|nr:hypothetical protein BO86DRAFT_415703 [Aspergillus japonicus CBS 114.51]PYI15781.1 hypothetical protein BO99DRAFT_425259 [Aspergillus violaceofuscus CBS 115571]RAH86244.1 hypothetical protein BO86DRAFT_415703 [Aspergillus japonicus CBS 114.51]
MAPKSIRVPKDYVNKSQGRAIEIVVGDEQKVYGVHEGLIRSSSPFFDKAMAGEWTEIVALYIHWLYYSTLPVFCDEPGLFGNSEYLDLVKAYVLGDKILDIRFQDTVIDAIVEKCHSIARDGLRWYPVGEVLEYAYHNLAASAPILELFVDIYVAQASSSWLHDWADPTTIPQPLLLRLASKLLNQRDTSEEPLEASKYHCRGKNPNKLSSTDR